MKLEELRARGLPPEKLAALEKTEEKLADAYGADRLDGAVKVARFKRGAPYFRKSVLALYGGAGQGKLSIFTPRAQAEARRASV